MMIKFRFHINDIFNTYLNYSCIDIYITKYDGLVQLIEYQTTIPMW